jgi:DsbC/DsbD-like thiol-disulfide interchange protein
MRLPLAILCLAAVSPLPGAAETSGAVPGAVEGVTLLDGWRQSDGSRLAGIEIRLGPGWHTYWRAPGSGGIAPTFDWSGSENLASAATDWPRPDLFESFGTRSIGYAGRVVLPVRLVPADPSAPLDLDLALDFGVCADICSLAEARIDQRIAPDAPEEGRAAIEAALAARVESAAEAGVAEVTCGLQPEGRGYALTARVTFAAEPFPDEVAVLEPGQPDIWIGDASSRTEGNTLTARARVRSATGGAGPMLERRALRLTLLDEGRAVDIRGCEAPR